MSVLLLILGFVCLITVTSDILVTTLTVRGGGFLTNRVSSWLWHQATLIHRYKKSNHRLLEVMGLWLIIGMAISWYVLTWGAWSLIFCSFQDAIINSSDQAPASIWGRIYFTAYTMTTLGRGDYLPSHTIWHLLTAIASANGFFLFTLSITYLFPIVSAASQKHSLAVYITSLGGTADEILSRAWNGKDFGNLDQHLINLTPQIIDLAEKHLTYPVLHYFHTSTRVRCLPLSIVALDEALTLLKYAVPPEHIPDAATMNAVRRANTVFLKTLKSIYLEPNDDEPPIFPLSLLTIHAIPTVDNSDFVEETEQIHRRRKLLLALVENDGWSWGAIASSDTTNRGLGLDDKDTIDS
ncbi:MAG: ion channel [Limnothrix sp.]